MTYDCVFLHFLIFRRTNTEDIEFFHCKSSNVILRGEEHVSVLSVVVNMFPDWIAVAQNVKETNFVQKGNGRLYVLYFFFNSN